MIKPKRKISETIRSLEALDSTLAAMEKLEHLPTSLTDEIDLLEKALMQVQYVKESMTDDTRKRKVSELEAEEAARGAEGEDGLNALKGCLQATKDELSSTRQQLQEAKQREREPKAQALAALRSDAEVAASPNPNPDPDPKP